MREAFPHFSVHVSLTQPCASLLGYIQETAQLKILPDLHLADAKKLGHHLVAWGQSSSWGTFSL